MVAKQDTRPYGRACRFIPGQRFVWGKRLRPWRQSAPRWTCERYVEHAKGIDPVLSLLPWGTGESRRSTRCQPQPARCRGKPSSTTYSCSPGSSLFASSSWPRSVRRSRGRRSSTASSCCHRAPRTNRNGRLERWGRRAARFGVEARNPGVGLHRRGDDDIGPRRFPALQERANGLSVRAARSGPVSCDVFAIWGPSQSHGRRTYRVRGRTNGSVVPFTPASTALY